MKLRPVLLLGLGLGFAGHGQPPAPPPAPVQARADPAQVRRRLDEIQARLKAVDAQVEALKKRRKGVLVELQAVVLDTERVRAQAEAARLKRDATNLEVAAITARKAAIQQDIDRLRVELRKQVRWMQAKGPLGDWTFIAGLPSFEEYVVRERYLTYLRHQERDRLARIQGLQAELELRERELEAALQRLASEEQASLQAQAGLQFHQDRLQQFLTDLGNDESRQKEAQMELAEEAIQLEHMLTQLLNRPRADTFEAPGAFAALRGELPQPTPGTLAQAFGEHLHPLFHTKTMQTGLLIAGVQGTPVQAVANGKVVFAEPFQSFGWTAIVEHGDGYYSIYTHLDALTVARGRMLKQGDVLGAVGNTVDGPRLGFEIRHQTQPEDPNRWLKVPYR